MNWLVLDSVEQFSQLLQTHDAGSFAVFKHSTRCSVSRLSKDRIERNWGALPEKFRFYYLDLLTYRLISDAIERILEVEHQSPQVLLIENGICTFHSSHSDINVSELAEKIN